MKNQKAVLALSLLLTYVIVLSCGFLKSFKNKKTGSDYKPYQPPVELNAEAPHTQFTVKIEGQKGIPVSGYITPIGKQVLERFEIEGETPKEYETVEANKIFLKVVKPGVGGFIKVTVLDKNDVLFCDSTNVDKKYIQIIAYPGNTGFWNPEYHDTTELKSAQLNKIAGYVRVTCEKPMIASVQVTKDFYQNNIVSSWEGKTPFVLPVGYCDYFNVEAYNDRNVMWDFTCEILDADKKVIRLMKCDSHQPGINIGSSVFSK
ncbi:MAG: hypothetical protein K1X86_15680 [Ignavibacteria bacterium]|nr:hypothetical protein [Ignavibacteria bacterium]